MKYTADVVAVDSNGRLLLIKRRWAPFEGSWALPGGHVDPSDVLACPEQPSRAAAVRELAEETGLMLNRDDLVFIGTFDAEGRDPRGPYSTDAYLVIVPAGLEVDAADDATEARWVPEEEITSLAFDHTLILCGASAVMERANQILAEADAWVAAGGGS